MPPPYPIHPLTPPSTVPLPSLTPPVTTTFYIPTPPASAQLTHIGLATSFLSAPILHIIVLLWRPLRARHGTNMSQFSHIGWGRFPSSKMMIVSRTCLLQKCTRIAVRVPALPGHPSTGHSAVPPLGNSSLYVCFSSPSPPPVAAYAHAHFLSRALPCCIMRWESSDPAAISLPQSPHIGMSNQYHIETTFVNYSLVNTNYFGSRLIQTYLQLSQDISSTLGKFPGGVYSISSS